MRAFMGGWMPLAFFFFLLSFFFGKFFLALLHINDRCIFLPLYAKQAFSCVSVFRDTSGVNVKNM